MRYMMSDPANSVQAVQAADSARALAATLITYLRDFTARQASTSEATGNVLISMTRDREITMWLVLALAVMIGTAIMLATVQSMGLPLARLQTSPIGWGPAICVLSNLVPCHGSLKTWERQ